MDSVIKTSVGRVSISSISSITKRSVSISSVQKTSIGLSLWLSLGRPLGDMDNTGRVGDIPSSSSVQTRGSRDGSGSSSSDSYAVSNVGHSVPSGVVEGGIGGVGGVGVAVAGQATVTTVAVMSIE